MSNPLFGKDKYNKLSSLILSIQIRVQNKNSWDLKMAQSCAIHRNTTGTNSVSKNCFTIDAQAFNIW